MENVVLEFCSNISLNPPFLIRNDTLLMPPLEERTIDDVLLETADNDTPPSDLIYTLVSQPVHGSLNFKGDTLSIGDTFSQEELSTLGILYRHNDEQYLSDYFSFTIIDGAGGWDGITNFKFTIDPSLPTQPYQYESIIPLKIYPKPNRGNFTIEIDNDIHIFDIQIITLDGKLIHHIQGPKNTNPIQLNNVASGVYIIKVNTEIGIINKKVLIQQP